MILTSPGIRLRRNRLAPFVLGLLVVPLSSCGGGGGGAPPWDRRPGNPGFKLDDGNYDIQAFGWKDPRPPSFHPLLTDRFRAVARRELLGFVRGPVPRHPVFLWDDAAANHGEGPTLDRVRLGGNFRVLDAAAGPLSTLQGEEMALIGLRPSPTNAKPEFRIRFFRLDDKGRWTDLKTLDLPNGLRIHEEARIALGDLDGDGFSELVLWAREKDSRNAHYAWLKIFDDPPSGAREILHIDLGVHPSTTRFELKVADLDIDGMDEILLLRNDLMNLRDDAKHGFKPLGGPRIRDALGFVTGEFDGKPGADVAFPLLPSGGEQKTRFFRFDTASGGLVEIGIGLHRKPGISLQKTDAWVRGDLDGNRIDEVYLLAGRTLFEFRPLPSSGKWTARTFETDLSLEFDELAALDDDGDARDELILGKIYPGNLNTTFDIYRTESTQKSSGLDLTRPLFLKRKQYAVTSNSSSRIRILGADFDREAFVLRFTGTRRLVLPDPVPLLVVHAPPAKGGIGQSIAESGTSTIAPPGAGGTHEISVGAVLSHDPRLDAAALDRVLTSPVRNALAGQVRLSMGKAGMTAFLPAFEGAWNRDAVLFLGALFQSFEYEVLESPVAGLAGNRVALLVPVATKTYRWSFEKYNRSMPVTARLSNEVRPHSTGDPASYLRKAQIEALLKGFRGWMSPGHAPMIGRGHREISLPFKDPGTKVSARTYEIDPRSGYSVLFPGHAGVRPLGAGKLENALFRVKILSGTLFRGRLGGYPDRRSARKHGFEWGLYVLQFGLDPKGNPVPGRIPVPVLGYWVDRLGSGY